MLTELEVNIGYMLWKFLLLMYSVTCYMLPGISTNDKICGLFSVPKSAKE